MIRDNEQQEVRDRCFEASFPHGLSVRTPQRCGEMLLGSSANKKLRMRSGDFRVRHLSAIPNEKRSGA